MGKFAIGIIALIVGLIAGVLIGGPLIGGAMAGAGAGVGLSAGICSTVGAAQELNYLTGEQVDEVMERAAEDISAEPIADGQQIVGSAAACRDVMANLKKARNE
jgi:hypothetical protein